MAYTEFACRSGGNNLNAGTLDGVAEPTAAAAVTYVAGDWNAATDIYTAPVGAVMTEAVVGRFASVYVDGDTNPTTNQFLVGRITVVNAGTRQITISASARSLLGTEVATATGTRSMRIGGAWKGPNAAIGFPYAFIGAALTDAALNRPRVNLKNDQTYAITAGITHNVAGPVKTQGYTSTYADGGRATIDGGTSGASYALFTNSGATHTSFEDVIFQNNGATGSASLVDHTTSGNAFGVFRRCVFAHSRGHGINMAQAIQNTLIECEAYDCNQSNTANLAGVCMALTARAIRCISHDHTAGVNAHGFLAVQSAVLVDCIAANNAGAGFKSTTSNANMLCGCDFYNNALDGVLNGAAGGNTIFYIENCNFFKNTGRGINLVAGDTVGAGIVNCAFGSGTAANAAGDTSITVGTDVAEIIGSVTYPANTYPWVDPANGDFTINHASGKGAGRGSFLQTFSGWSAPNTIGDPDIGAAQHLDMSVQPTYGVGI